MLKLVIALSLCIAFSTLALSDQKPVASKEAKAAEKAGDVKKALPGSDGKKTDPVKPQGKKDEGKSDPNFELARKVADFTEKVADYTAALFWATFALAAVGIAQAFMLAKQFITTNRPRMVVRRFQLIFPEGQQPGIVEFVVANEGPSIARLTEHSFNVKILSAHELKEMEKRSFPLFEKSKPIFREKFAPWKRLALNVQLVGFKDPVAAFAAVAQGEAKLLCYGYIRYRDRLYGRYETRFYRTYVLGDQFFTASTDPDYDDSGIEQAT